MTLDELRDIVDRGLERVLILLMGVAVLNVLWQVFTRFVINAPSGFTEELARYLLIWIGILGSGYVAGQRGHLALELLPERLEGRQLVRLKIVIEACVLAFALIVMTIGGIRLVYTISLSGQTSSAMGLSLGYVYAAVPLAGMLIVFYSSIHLVEEIRTLNELPEESSARDDSGAADA